MARFGRVVVVGNSFAGLLTASVLAPHADHLTIIDRDRIPDEPEYRAGVPQGRHIHVLLASGQRSLEALFPGIVAEMRERDIPEVGTPRDLVQFQRGRWCRRFDEGIAFLTGTRPLLEQVLRRRVLADPRIETIDAVEAVGLIGDRSRVRGLLIRGRGGVVPGRTEELAANLVVDASGRGSHTPEWLTEIGAKPPFEERIDSGLTYATRVYHGPVSPGYQGIYLVPNPEAPRGGVIMATEEKGTYLVTLSGLPSDPPPSDPQGFEKYTTKLPHPIVFEWVKSAQPKGPPMGFRGTANVRRRYDRLGGRPAGLLVVGDAVCAFNPIYGQGMSVAALGALNIRKVLRKRRPSLARLQRIIIDAAAPAWVVSGGADKKMPGATGNAVEPGPADRFADWYLTRVDEHSAGSGVVGMPFRRVLHLVAPVTSLFAWPVFRTVVFSQPRPTPEVPPTDPEES